MTNPINNPELFDKMNTHTSIIKVIGVGGGGGNAVAHMYSQGIVGVDFAICNTDNQALDSNDVPIKIQLGPSLTEGRGAGSKPEIGKESCIESIDEVRSFLDSGTKMLFVTAGMGGGTGTGAAPIIAKAAKEMGILTVGIVTLPFKFEGNKRKRHALEGLEKMRKNVDAILVISNDRLREMYGDLTMRQAFSKADDILTTGAKGIAEIITVPGYINVDFADVSTVMKDSGVAMMGTGEAEGEDRATRAVEMALNSPLLEDKEIRGAKNILFNITSGNIEVTMDEIGLITEYIQEEAGYGTDVIWGNCVNPDLGDKIAITVIATGFSENVITESNDKPKQIMVGLDDGEEVLRKATVPSPSAATTTIDLDIDDVKSTIASFKSESEPSQEPRIKFGGNPTHIDRKLDELERAKKAYIRKAKTVPLDNPGVVSKMEKEPAYLRREVQLDSVEEANNDGTMSNTRINVDDNGDFFTSENSFLHGNVD